MQAYRKIVILLIELRAVALVSPKLAYTHDHQRMDLNAWSQSLKQVRRFMLRRWRGRRPKPNGTWRKVATRSF
jgi:hypothetical protein